MESPSNAAPHRGFNAKVRDVLIGDNYENLINLEFRGGMPHKSSSDFNLHKRVTTSNSRQKKDSNGDSPKSQTSVCSIPEHPTFDTIGERPKVKKHVKLSEIGKAHSCVELKTSDKRLLRTYHEENIIRMPSMESDVGTSQRSEIDELCLSFEGVGKAMLYSQSDNNNADDTKNKKK
ncbi:unnamed protein product [Caenorhabditis sp. 36 PRJEB53466]|nr:unnamed protein product [Caenorhabditis sp. 36 PRJEB53466]